MHKKVKYMGENTEKRVLKTFVVFVKQTHASAEKLLK